MFRMFSLLERDRRDANFIEIFHAAFSCNHDEDVDVIFIVQRPIFTHKLRLTLQVRSMSTYDAINEIEMQKTTGPLES